MKNDWVSLTYERLIGGLIEDNYSIVEDFFSPSLVLALQNNINTLFAEEKMRRAGIGNLHLYEKDVCIRGDFIHWLNRNTDNEAEKKFFEELDHFVQYLNLTCFTAIQELEFHYAVYPVGSYFKRHLDQLKSDDARQFTFILYLNDDWKTENEGELLMYLQDREVKIMPEAGRVLFFKSDAIEHEVLPTLRERHSITGWFKVNSLLP